ncbi:MAG: hypothetical protein AAFW00_04070 [Bacteroidota bacterium]
MNDLWELVQTFTAKEKRACKKYLRKVIEGGESKERKLFDLILQGEGKDAIHEKLFPGKLPKDSGFRELNSQLLKRLKPFLIQEFLSRNNIERERLFLKILEERGQSFRFNRERNKLIKSLEKGSAGPEFHFYAYELAQEAYNHHRLEAKKLNSSVFQAMDENLDRLWIFEKLQLAITHAQLVRKLGAEATLRPAFLDELLWELKQSDSSLLKQPGVKLMRDVYLIQINEKVPEPTSLKKAFLADQKSLSLELRQFLFDNVSNILVRQATDTYQKEEIYKAYDWYKLGMESGIIYRNEILNHFHYQNIIHYAILLERKEEAQSLIDRETSKLMEMYQQPYSQLAKAILAYSQGNFSTVHRLSQYAYPSPYVEINITFLMIRVTYDTEPHSLVTRDHVLSYLQRINMRIRSAKDMGEVMKEMLNKRRLQFNALVQARTKEARMSLREKINSQPPTVDTAWFLKHLDD